MYAAIVVSKCGGPEVLKIVKQQLPKVIKPNEILVKVMAAGVNPVDTYIRSGGQGYNPTLPYVPGFDLAGEVQLVGSQVKQFKVGSRIYSVKAPFSTSLHSGAYAEYCTMNTVMAHHLPDNVTYEQGACIGVPYYTAYKALFLNGQAKPGQSVLVHGASGAVGLATCQLAKSRGLEVIGTASTDEGKEAAIRSGASQIFNHRDEDYIQNIKEAYPKGIDIIVEMLADVNLQNDLGLVAPEGKILVVGSRGDITITPRILMTKYCSITGVRYGSTTPAELKEIESHLYAGLEQGSLNPIVNKSYQLHMACDAHVDIIVSSGARGNLVLTTKYTFEYDDETAIEAAISHLKSTISSEAES